MITLLSQLNVSGMNQNIVISVCVGSNCSAKGNTKLSAKLKKHLKSTGLNKQIKLKFQPCSDNCDKGPVIVLDQVVIYQKSLEEIKHYIDGLT